MKVNKPLRYASYDVVFQEVPNEVSLVFNITGCPHKCCGCHSDYLWKYYGEILEQDIDEIIQKYTDMITCVCFMGGDQNIENLIYLLKIVRNKYKLKTCVYSGCNDINLLAGALSYLNYLKIGRYEELLGGLDSPSTNQRFYKVEDKQLYDTTYLFQKEKTT